MRQNLRRAVVGRAVCGVVWVGLVGCGSDPGPDAKAAASAKQIPNPVPADSIFAKVRIGESMEQVQAELPPATSTRAYTTGKAYIPFNFGGHDAARTVVHYKGVGHLVLSLGSVYSGRYAVSQIVYNPADAGYD